jgi:hypothetical protein
MEITMWAAIILMLGLAMTAWVFYIDYAKARNVRNLARTILVEVFGWAPRKDWGKYLYTETGELDEMRRKHHPHITYPVIFVCISRKNRYPAEKAWFDPKCAKGRIGVELVKMATSPWWCVLSWRASAR